MTGEPRFLTFGWWNLHNFAHYDAERTSGDRWPKRLEDYEAKRGRILAAFQEIFGDNFPDLLAVCEITREAAADLVVRLPGAYQVSICPPYPRDDRFQVAVFYRPSAGFSAEAPLIPSEHDDVTLETRPMIPIQLATNGHVIRFVACHWTAFEDESSQLARERIADVLRRDCHRFLRPRLPKPGVTAHVVILGDLNDEPTARIFRMRLLGQRARASCRRTHGRDAQAKRIRFYNAAWRYLGEQVAHGTPGQPVGGPAGTCVTKNGNWKTFDHVLVSGGLLSTTPPYFDEAQTKIVSTPIMCDERGLPQPYAPDVATGVSDHFPIVGRLVLPE